MLTRLNQSMHNSTRRRHALTGGRACLILLVFMLASISCNENSTGFLPSEPILNGPLLTGKIERWYYGAINPLDLQVQRQSIGQTQVNGAGYFLVGFPLLRPPDSLLKRFSSLTYSDAVWQIKDDLVFSDSTAEYGQLQFIAHPASYIGTSLYAGNNFLLSDSGTAIGDFSVSFYYFNKPTRITGASTWTFKTARLIEYYGHTESVTNYHINVQAGWNPLTTTITSDDGYRRIYTVSSGYPMYTKWFLSAASVSWNFVLARRF